MRPLGGLLVVLMAGGAASAARADGGPPTMTPRALFDAAFVSVAPPAVASIGWGSGGVLVSTLSVIRPSAALAPRSDNRFDGETQAVGVNYSHGWPAALRVSRGGVNFEVTPHAGFGVSNDGQSAEAGAEVQFGAHLRERVINGLGGLGLKTIDSAAFGDRGRWYLFAAASGQSVGLNVMRDAQGDLRRSGWSADSASSLISDAQAGVGWRKGDMQASVGYVHREVKPLFADGAGAGPGRSSGSMVAVSFSIHP